MTAIYARQSIDRGEQSLSIESQYEECGKRVGKDNTIEFYSDKGYSGSNTNRPDFTRLMNDIKCGRIQRLIVWKLDRISRSLMDFANILSVFEKHGVAFDSVTEQLDTATPMGRAMISIIMVFAQLERETIQMRIAANYRKRAERGFFLGGPAAFGLVKRLVTVNGYRTSAYELCPEYGKVLLLIFDKYANSDISLGALARFLNENGFTTQNETLWDSQKLSRILHNPTYVMSDADIYRYYKSKGVRIISPVEDFAGNGLFLFGKRRTNERKYTDLREHSLAVALHGGFIDSRTWLKAQYRLSANRQIKNSGKGKYTWLSGIVKCGKCNYAMTGQNTKTHVLLRCSRHMNVGDCDAQSVNADGVEIMLWQAILGKLDELRGVEFIERAGLDSKDNRVKAELIKVEEQIDSLVCALANGEMPKSITRRIAELESRQEELASQLHDGNASAAEINTETVLALVRENLSLDEKKRVARALVERVYVIKDEAPRIIWRF